MDAMTYLFTTRDLQLCGTHKQVNGKLRGYIPRVQSQFLGSEISNVLFDATISLDSMLQHPIILDIINNKTFLTCYRTVIPYFWSAMSEWVFAIVDTATSSVNFVHPFYASDFNVPISFNLLLKDKINTVLHNTIGQEYVSGKWTFLEYDLV
jgi:hypothetical protein